MEPVVETTLTQVKSLLEDDTNTTRTLACRVMTRIFDLMGDTLDQDRLHNMYPDLLKVRFSTYLVEYLNMCSQDEWNTYIYQ